MGSLKQRTESINDLLRVEDEMKDKLRLARGHNFREAWNRGENIFAILGASALQPGANVTSRIIDRSGAFKTLELTTITPWIKKNDELEMRAARMQHQDVPNWLGRVVLHKQPQELETTQFTLEQRPFGYNVGFKEAVIEHGHPRGDRIVFPYVGLIAGTQDERYDSWHERDLAVIADLRQITDHLRAEAPKPLTM